MGALPGRRGLTHLPRVAARDHGDAARSPSAELPADPTAVVRAFRRGEQAAVEAWVQAPAGATVIEVPLMGRRWARLPGGTQGGMAAGTPVGAHPGVWCGYGDVCDTRVALGMSGTA